MDQYATFLGWEAVRAARRIRRADTCEQLVVGALDLAVARESLVRYMDVMRPASPARVDLTHRRLGRARTRTMRLALRAAGRLGEAVRS